MNVKEYFKNIFRTKPSPVIEVTLVTSSTLRLSQWRESKTLVAASRDLEKNKTFQMQLACLKNEHPVHSVFASIGINPSDRLAHQSKCEGYELAINNLDAMSKPLKLPERLMSTFEAPEETKRK